MTFELYIERKTPITITDWTTAVESIKGVRINDEDVVGINPQTGSEIRITSSEGDADVYLSKSKKWKKTYTYGPSISFDKPRNWNKSENEVRVATFQLAQLLSARVVDENGDVIEFKHNAATRKKPATKNVTVKESNPSRTNSTKNKPETKLSELRNKVRLLLVDLIFKGLKKVRLVPEPPRKLSLDIVVKCNSFSSAYELWEALTPLHETALREPIYNELTGNAIEAKNFVGAIKRNNRNDFSFRLGEGAISYNNSGSARGEVGQVLLENLSSSAKQIEGWISGLLEDDRFVMARLIDRPYDIKQNMTDISMFEFKGYKHAHLPKISNNLPRPLDRLIVDISNNPARRILKLNYFEAIGSTMWLGKDFWTITGSDKARILGADGFDGFDVVEMGRSVRIRAQETVFTQSEGIEAERQNALRALLFNGSLSIQEQ